MISHVGWKASVSIFSLCVTVCKNLICVEHVLSFDSPLKDVDRYS